MSSVTLPNLTRTNTPSEQAERLSRMSRRGLPCRRSLKQVGLATYVVNLTFDMSRRPYSEPGEGLQHLARFLPDSAKMRSAQAPPGGADSGLYTIDLSLPAATPAQALRDVARALELAALEVDPDALGEVQRATIERQPD